MGDTPRVPTDENKLAILEAVAAAEKRRRPFENRAFGISYDDIVDEFETSDFGLPPTMYIPPRLAELSDREPPVLKQVYPGGSATSANYRLTGFGWGVVDEDRPRTVDSHPDDP